MDSRISGNSETDHTSVQNVRYSVGACSQAAIWEWRTWTGRGRRGQAGVNVVRCVAEEYAVDIGSVTRRPQVAQAASVLATPTSWLTVTLIPVRSLQCSIGFSLSLKLNYHHHYHHYH